MFWIGLTLGLTIGVGLDHLQSRFAVIVQRIRYLLILVGCEAITILDQRYSLYNFNVRCKEILSTTRTANDLSADGGDPHYPRLECFSTKSKALVNVSYVTSIFWSLQSRDDVNVTSSSSAKWTLPA